LPGEQTALLLRGGILVVSAFLSAFFSGSETALFSLPLEEVRRMEGSGGVEKIIARLLAHPKRLLTTILFGNMVVNVVFYSVSFLLIVEYGKKLGPTGSTALAVASLLIVIIFGELLPKNIAYAFARPLSRISAVPLLVFQKLFTPFVWALETITDGISALFGRRLHAEPFLRPGELEMLVDLSRRDGVLDHDIGDMIAGVMKLSSTPLRQVMVPRVLMACHDAQDPVEDLEELFRREKHTLIPVYEHRTENMLGVVHAKDFMLREEAADVRSLVQPIAFLPETATVQDALQRFREEKSRMAFVVDEYGSVEGLVTVEDITEEIVGEIRDEYEQEPVPDVERLGQRRYRVRGDLSVHEWHEMFEMDAPELPVDTIGGLVMTLLDRIPREGDVVRYRNLELKVEKTRGQRVASVILELAENGPPQGGPPKGGDEGQEGGASHA